MHRVLLYTGILGTYGGGSHVVCLHTLYHGVQHPRRNQLLVRLSHLASAMGAVKRLRFSEPVCQLEAANCCVAFLCLIVATGFRSGRRGSFPFLFHREEMCTLSSVLATHMLVLQMIVGGSTLNCSTSFRTAGCKCNFSVQLRTRQTQLNSLTIGFWCLFCTSGRRVGQDLKKPATETRDTVVMNPIYC